MESGKPQHAKRQMESAGVWGSTGWGSSDKNEGRVGAVFSAEQCGGFLSAERRRSASDGGSSRGKEQRKLNRGSGGGLLERAVCGPGGAGEAASGACGLDQMGARVGQFGLGAFSI